MVVSSGHHQFWQFQIHNSLRLAILYTCLHLLLYFRFYDLDCVFTLWILCLLYLSKVQWFKQISLNFTLRTFGSAYFLSSLTLDLLALAKYLTRLYIPHYILVLFCLHKNQSKFFYDITYPFCHFIYFINLGSCTPEQ